MASFSQGYYNSFQTISLSYVSQSILFNTQGPSVGNDITLNSITGIFTLKANKTYRLRGSLNTVFFNDISGSITMYWKNITSSSQIGVSNKHVISPFNYALQYTSQFETETIFDMTYINTDVQVALWADCWNVSQIGSSTQFPWFDIEVIGGNAPVTLNTGPTGTTGPQGIPGTATNTGTTGPTGPSLWTLSGRNIYYVAGNVGIGLQTPQNTLDVSGLVRIVNDDGVINLQGNSLTNMGVGSTALNALTTGIQNTAFGYNALSLITTGSYNTAIGYNAFNSATTTIQSTAIGYNAQPTANNQIVLGTATERVFIPGTTASSSIYTGALQVTGGVGVQGNIYSGNLYVNNNAYANYFITTSDYRIKKDPQPLGNLYSVDNLNPVQYTNILSNKQDMGFLAHEVQEIYPFLVEGEKDGDTTQALNYQGLIALLVKEIQDLKKRVAILEQK
jgi:hypothetical protein